MLHIVAIVSFPLLMLITKLTKVDVVDPVLQYVMKAEYKLRKQRK